MKKFYTSNFKNIKNVSNPLAISRKPPDWYSGAVCKELCPTWNLVSDYKQGIINSSEYEELYKLELQKNNADFTKLAEELPEFTTFLCFEPKNQFCHRHLIAKYLNEITGILVTEL